MKNLMAVGLMTFQAISVWILYKLCSMEVSMREVLRLGKQWFTYMT